MCQLPNNRDMKTPSKLMLLLELVGSNSESLVSPEVLRTEGFPGSHSFGRRLQQSAPVLVRVKVGILFAAPVQLDSRLHAWVIVDSKRLLVVTSPEAATCPALGRPCLIDSCHTPLSSTCAYPDWAHPTPSLERMARLLQAPTASLSTSPGRTAVPLSLQTELDTEDKLSEIIWRCNGSGTRFIQPPGCARTVSSGRVRKFEYTQGGLGSESACSFHVSTFDGIDWRERSDELNTTTLSFNDASEVASAVDMPSPCGPKSLTLAESADIITQRLGASVTSSECIWRAGSDKVGDLLVQYHSEPYDTSDDDSAMAVGTTFFNPVTSDDVIITVKSGLTSITVIEKETGCERKCARKVETSIDGTTTPANGAAATATLDEGKLINVTITKAGFGFTSLPTVRVENCVGSVMAVKVSFRRLGP